MIFVWQITSPFSMKLSFSGQQKLFSIFKSQTPSQPEQATTCAPAIEPLTPVADRVVNAEAMVLSYVAENSKHFSEVPKLISLAKALAADKPALDQLSMDRTSASYKMTHGLSKTFQDKLINDLKTSKFSLNIDEATSSNNQKVLAVMVSYFCSDANDVVIKHLDSISVIKVDADTLFKALDSLFQKHEIPWENLVSVLMDSCAVMRGSKNGLEQKIKSQRAPHLLDIDGDSCHHAHNAAKRFCEPFKGHIEGLVSDLHSDFKWSVDHKEALMLICSILSDLKYTVPQRYIPHRWLSIYDVSLDTIRLLDAYTVFFYFFLSDEDKGIFQDVLEGIYTKHSVDASAKEGIRKIMKPILRKNLTREGKERKNRITVKLFDQRIKTLLILQVRMLSLTLYCMDNISPHNPCLPKCHLLH